MHLKIEDKTLTLGVFRLKDYLFFQDVAPHYWIIGPWLFETSIGLILKGQKTFDISTPENETTALTQKSGTNYP